MALPRKVRPVPHPDGQRLGSDLPPQLYTCEVVFHRLCPRRRVGVGERAKLVAVRLIALVLKGVRIQSIKAQDNCFALAQQIRQSGAVPGNVQRYRWRCCSQLMDQAALVELVKDPARFARAGKTRKAGAPRTHAPGRDSVSIGRHLILDSGDVDAAPVQMRAQSVIICAQGLGGLNG